MRIGRGAIMSLPKSLRRWAYYDFANSSYVLIYQAFLLPVFFSTVLAEKGFSLSSWGIANGVSTLIGVFLAVIVGNYADKYSRIAAFKKSVYGSFVGMLLISIAVQYFQEYVFHLY